MNKITILGTGTSTGVPILGCNCQVCQSNDPRNNRLRTSAVIQTRQGKNILFDASPDLRTQLLKAKISQIDAMVLTHDHADHVHGIDDLRPFCFTKNSPIPVYANEESIQELNKKFPYIFDRQNYFQKKAILGGGVPLLDLVSITMGHFSVNDESFEFYLLPHGHESTIGIRHGKMAYLVDCRDIPISVVTNLNHHELDLLVIDCLRYIPHQTHLHLDRSLELISQIRPKLSVLTHMGHELDYLDLLSQIEARGIKNVLPGIDGQCFFYS